MNPDMDIVFIEQLKLETIIGIHDWEREKKQTITLDIDIGCSIQSAAASDKIEHCIDYFSVCERIKKLAQVHQYQLVETFAEEVSRIILYEFTAQWVRVKLNKPEAVHETNGVGVIIERHHDKNQHLVYVGIGSNIEQEKYIRLAVQYLQESFGKHCQLRLSPVYKTQAIGFDGDDFFNLVASFSTKLSPFGVEKKLKEIEHKNGRRRGQEKFSARTLDIDLLLYDQEIISSESVNIPRDEIEKYAFVLSPLADLSPKLIHPKTKKSIQEMWQKLSQSVNAGALEKIDFSW